MRHLAPAMLVVVAVIHLLPLSGALGVARLQVLYGIPFDEPNLAILMRHRAVLFGLLGVFLLYAVIRQSYRTAAFIAGFVSVVSFLALAGSTPSFNDALRRVVTADVIALACLVIGVVAHAALPRRNTRSDGR